MGRFFFFEVLWGGDAAISYDYKETAA